MPYRNRRIIRASDCVQSVILHSERKYSCCFIYIFVENFSQMSLNDKSIWREKHKETQAAATRSSVYKIHGEKPNRFQYSFNILIEVVNVHSNH